MTTHSDEAAAQEARREIACAIMTAQEHLMMIPYYAADLDEETGRRVCAVVDALFALKTEMYGRVWNMEDDRQRVLRERREVRETEAQP